MKHEESTKIILYKVGAELEHIHPGRDQASGTCLAALMVGGFLYLLCKRWFREEA